MQIIFHQIEKQDLLNVLRRGRTNAIVAGVLAQNPGDSQNHNEVEISSLIKEFIENDGEQVPAVTGRPAGFFIINSLIEPEGYNHILERSARCDNKTRTALINSWIGNSANTQTTIKSLIIT